MAAVRLRRSTWLFPYIQTWLLRPHGTWLQRYVASLMCRGRSISELPPQTRLMLADVDAGSDTPSLVGKVLKWRKENPTEGTPASVMPIIFD